MCDSFWEPVAEIYLVDREKADNVDDYYGCVVSRVVLGDTKSCTVLSSENDSEEEAIEKDFMEWTLDLDKGSRIETQSTEKHDEEPVSCYGSASHTDNNYSTDEHDSVRDSAYRSTIHASAQKLGLHQSDSGADLSEYRDQHEVKNIQNLSAPHGNIFKTTEAVTENDCKNMDMLTEYIECDKELITQSLATNTTSKAHNEDNSFTEYNYIPYINSYSAYHGSDETEMHKAWLHFWAENGERIIWTSWIKKYADYINPDYFQSNTAKEDEKPQYAEVNEPAVEKFYEHDTCSPSEMCRNCEFLPSTSSGIFHRDDSSDDRILDELPQDQAIGDGWNPLSQPSIEENYNQYSNAEDERLLTRCDSINGSIAKTNVASDSMTNVTKMTLTSSSYDSSSSFSSCSSASSLSLNLDIFFESSAQESDTTSTSDPEDNFRGEHDKDWQQLWWEHFELQYRQQYELFVLSYAKAHSVDQCRSMSDEYDAEADLSDDAIQINKSSPNKVRSSKNGKISRNMRPSTSYKNKTENLILSSVGALLKNLAVDPSVSATSSSFAEEDQQIVSEERSVSWVPVSSRRRSRQKRGSVSSQGLSNVSLMEVFFKSERSVKWYGDITFRKRNIIWKTIKSVRPRSERLSEPSSSDTEAILQNKDLRSLRHEELEPVIDKADEYSTTTICQDTNTDGDPGPSKMISNQQRTCTFSSSSEALDSQFEWDDNEEIITHELTELDVFEGNENSKEELWERRRCKRMKTIDDTMQLPQEIKNEKNLQRYWLNRYELFHKYDEGIQLDKESWYSVTPERIAKQIARRCKCNVIVDAFCGAGGNAIQFAFTCNKVIAIDIDPKKIECARNNAKIYGVEEKIEFIIDDFLKVAPGLEADIVFLSPPWGGPKYSDSSVFDIKTLLSVGGEKVYKAARRISTSVAYFLPKNVNIKQVRMLARRGHGIETEQYFEENKAIAVTCYYGGLVAKTESLESTEQI
ncbi:trimethylguanosine synthase isoform X2 [Odontomachus brunneus]|uniref:trimethylguanosine synthase isoform X2 n=1 Tax=Odontomachus brunneus TaxID=486640 RepID=UPI0013F1D147|nr:trimethylguanosine synthase isoform X2 [Odontomachus brunneus]